MEGLVAVELDVEGSLELAQGPAVVFFGVVAGKVGGGDVGDNLTVDADNLGESLLAGVLMACSW